jgi:hypothetical protein
VVVNTTLATSASAVVGITAFLPARRGQAVCFAELVSANGLFPLSAYF